MILKLWLYYRRFPRGSRYFMTEKSKFFFSRGRTILIDLIRDVCI
nr:MAG TPA: hypothetical protein [Bacteriophage sp.]